MSRNTIITCDQCVAQKKETNHWFNIWTEEALDNIDLRMADFYVHITKFNNQRVGDNVKDICGHWCLMQCISRLLDSRKEA